MIESASEYQRSILADGEITRADYERAMLETARCMEDRGISVEIRTDSDGTIQVTYGGVQTLDELNEMHAAYDECAAEYSDVVNLLWQSENRSSEQDRLKSIVPCLRNIGFEVETMEDVVRVQNEVLETDPERFPEILECTSVQ